jgi:hypothetical protein
MASRRTGGSFIPRKAQIPAMIVGAAILVAILGWRLKQRGERAASAPSTTVATTAGAPTGAPAPDAVSSATVDTAAQMAEIARIEAEILKERGEIDKVRAAYNAPPEVFKPVADNPFRDKAFDSNVALKEEASRILDNVAGAGPGDGARATGPLAEAKDAGLNQDNPLVLVATYFMGKTSLAIVSGRVLKPGDRIEGFAVESIREREMTLTNGLRTLKLKMEGVPGL